MSIPKNIWAIWCDFKNKKDGVLNEQISYFKDRIIKQHPGWEVNIIVSWDVLIQYISTNAFLMNLINNEFVNPAHKSDSIRFFLLKEYGGFWLDISTFLFKPLDIYYELQPNAKFIGFYTPPFMVEEIIFSSLGDMFDNVKYDQVVKKFKSQQANFIKLNEKYKKYPFIPENFFIASTPNHEIVTDTYNQLEEFWTSAFPNITSAETLCYEINKLMSNLAKEIFDINDINYTTSTLFDSKDITNEKYSLKTLDNIWHCGYVFNYLQMYKSIVNYMIKNDSVITQETNENAFSDPEYTDILCSTDENINACKNIVATNKDNVLYFMSLSQHRLIKWANTMNDRVTFENTYISEMINLVKKKELTGADLIEQIVKMGIYQIKFSSWTRDSNIIPKLMEIYPNNTREGEGKKRRKTKKRKDKKRKNKSKMRRKQVSENLPSWFV
jgi:mannosyltransferase OCH1-like enzyme